ncbi:hypothetical protein CI610_02815 [invertebrate metagenome]|uniref:Uncharacterized protein n=1 Tax=invertebrate metagenome TaxID=1711999 RepID=A0A2H9T4V7_9ZZZZ
MNWYSVGLAAASGGIAALIASLIFGKKPEKKTAYTIVVVVLFVVLNTLSKQFILPKLNAYKAVADIESSFNEIPAFASIKKYEPETYQRLVDSLAEVTNQGYNQQQAIDLVRTQISGLVESRMPHASDEAILTYMSVMVTEMDELHKQGKGLCYKLLLPQIEGGIDGRKVFSKETQKKDLMALDEIIKTSNTKKTIPSESAVMPSLEPIFVSLYSKFGDDVAMIENPTATNVDKDKVCSITMDLYKEILALPPEQAASALRWMFGQG